MRCDLRKFFVGCQYEHDLPGLKMLQTYVSTGTGYLETSICGTPPWFTTPSILSAILGDGDSGVSRVWRRVGVEVGTLSFGVSNNVALALRGSSRV